MPDAKSAPRWLQLGEKFALIGFPIDLHPGVSFTELPAGLSIITEMEFEFPDHWKEWLGTLRIEEIQECHLFMLAKSASSSPSVLDAEDQELVKRVSDWFTGLTLTRKFETSNEIFLASGSYENDSVDIRQFSTLEPPLASIVHERAPLTMAQLLHATDIAEGLHELAVLPNGDGWRLLRCLRIYQEARQERDVLERIHQFTRCVEGLIAAKPGGTKRMLKSRTETFIGPRHHELISELYDVRSDVEHLNENRHLETFDRSIRVRLAELEAVGEWIARSCLERILLSSTLISHFGNIDSIAKFWELDHPQRQRLWGEPVDPEKAIAGFKFQYVSDGELGARE